MLPSASDLRPCPHCGGQVRYEPDPQFLWVCGACGGPVIPGLKASAGPVVDKLAAAKSTRAGKFVRRLGAGFAAAAGVGFFGVALVLGFFSGVSAAVAGVLALSAFAGAFFAFQNSNTKQGEAQKLIDEAWLLYLADAIRNNTSSLSAEDVAAKAEIPVARAAELLESLARRGDIDLNITTEGRLTYSNLGTGPRIATEQEFAELEEESEAEKKRATRP